MPCEEKMNEAVADVGVLVTHGLRETIGMDAGGDCLEREVPVLLSVEQ